MDGHIVAVTSGDDLRHILRRLMLSDALKPQQIGTVLKRERAGEAITPLLLEFVDEDTLSHLMVERSKDNLSRFLGSSGTPKFTHLPAIFDDALQVYASTEDLVEECWSAWTAAQGLEEEAQLYLGSGTPSSPWDKAVASRVGSGTTVADLLIQLASEPIAARAELARMVQAGTLTRSPTSKGKSKSPGPPPEPDTFSIGYAEEDVDVAVDDMEPELEELQDEHADSPTEEHPLEQLKNPADWMPVGADTDEDLEAFEDHDEVRGGGDNDGSFTTQEHNLDRVEVVALDDAEPFNPSDTSTGRFSAPVLSSEEASSKIDVAQGVITTISHALDAAEGHGRAQAALQILTDGAPNNFKPLFVGCTMQDDGTLPVELILQNLLERPPSEHRRLLNEGLLNLIERYLSMAVDQLPDEAIDQVLEDVAGYRQRFGL
jgi:hypothetical protein